MMYCFSGGAMKKRTLIYLLGNIAILVSLFLPYIRYKFTYNEDRVEASFTLWNIKKLNTVPGLPELAVARFVPYILLVLVLVAFVVGFFVMTGKDDLRLATVVITVLQAAAFLQMRLCGAINTYYAMFGTIEENARTAGYTGSAGFGTGYMLLIAGIIISVVGSVLCITEES